ncbi:LOW QUALITY PROTEIN: transcription factor SAC51-like [Phalaenopsis equestris]|uniref:LOW QUALITY PROTEIN: transcription factor SAC51-like n=1 Tax=Phalaenopsis equestris TaxID=78828 RepID=UPI0009E3AC9A|nr:LOW QUALITY PROTEIN: transcription factor SAC51-like [Phalaenopsis equestris]
MVCQAATKTRFQALKHENGFAGGATIIVRVIVCFQPLQDCQEEMHEDTDEIDALLYSDSKFSFDSEEASTGHSPLNMNVKDVISSSIPAKRRKLNLDHSPIDESLIDTESQPQLPISMTKSDDNADISYVYSGNSVDGGDQERIHTIINVLRKIIPDGEAMDDAALLDEAILYLSYLKLEANSLDAPTESI